jgi:hypothetical protein
VGKAVVSVAKTRTAADTGAAVSGLIRTKDA